MFYFINSLHYIVSISIIIILILCIKQNITLLTYFLSMTGLVRYLSLINGQ